jgi:hypothetical protein
VPPPPGPVLILGDERTEDSVAAILTRAGLDVRPAGPYWQYAGGDLSDVSAVVLLTGVEWDQTMPDSVQQRLAAFVSAGGD